MRKVKFFFLFCLIFIFGYLFAEGFESKLKFGVGTFSPNVIALDEFHVQLGYEFEIAPFCGDVMIQGTKESFSISTDTALCFLNFRYFKAFARGFFCVEFVPNEKICTDTFCGLKIEIPSKGIFYFATELFTGIKTSRILAMPDILVIINADFACSATFTWKIPKSTEIYFKFSSFEIFYHPSFFAPIFSLGVSHEFKEKLLVGTEFVVRTIDLFTLSSFIDGFALRLRLEWKFK